MEKMDNRSGDAWLSRRDVSGENIMQYTDPGAEKMGVIL